ncbi:MAG: iron-containing alcohol dehydrogenase [Planctomycetota bacterium]|nr:iron-containing alcohol dehydrogenase [Planctomycetota bacterium]
MLAPTFSYLNDVYLAFGVAAKLPEILERHGIRRPLVVTDAGLVRLGYVDRLGLKDPAVFDAVQTNPTEASCRAGLARFREAGCDGLVALGGGSPIDLAKCVALGAHHEGPLESFSIGAGGMARITGRVPPLLAIPTTAGSGSEVGRAALLTLDDGRKLGFISPHLLPKAALCDPELTFDLPPLLTAATGMDALSHAVETFLSPRENPAADALALEGLRFGYAHIRHAVGDGRDREARRAMMLCSVLSGLAFPKSLGAVHSLSHPLGG